MDNILNCAIYLLSVGLSTGIIYGFMILLALGILDIFKKTTSK